MANHSSILVWKIPWTEEPGKLSHTHTHTHTHSAYILIQTPLTPGIPSGNPKFVFYVWESISIL